MFKILKNNIILYRGSGSQVGFMYRKLVRQKFIPQNLPFEIMLGPPVVHMKSANRGGSTRTIFLTSSIRIHRVIPLPRNAGFTFFLLHHLGKLVFGCYEIERKYVCRQSSLKGSFHARMLASNPKSTVEKGVIRKN